MGAKIHREVNAWFLDCYKAVKAACPEGGSFQTPDGRTGRVESVRVPTGVGQPYMVHYTTDGDLNKDGSSKVRRKTASAFLQFVGLDRPEPPRKGGAGWGW